MMWMLGIDYAELPLCLFGDYLQAVDVAQRLLAVERGSQAVEGRRKVAGGERLAAEVQEAIVQVDLGARRHRYSVAAAASADCSTRRMTAACFSACAARCRCRSVALPDASRPMRSARRRAVAAASSSERTAVQSAASSPSDCAASRLAVPY